MPELGDYLDLTPLDAARQWAAILARPPRPLEGRFRQVDFTPVETLLCLAATAVVDHRRFGGSTNAAAPSPVPELARLFGRTPASILAKQANLDGSRRNGARHEVETSQRVLEDPSLMTALYLRIFDAARAAGIGEDRLPDFLELEAVDDFELLGQDELDGEDLEAAIQSQLSRLAGAMGDVPESVTERLLVATIRIGQHRFATDVLSGYGHTCGFCGMRPTAALRRRGLLVASHVKPWRESTNRERLDPLNGIAACPTHDAAFDKGLLWVNGGYRIHRSPTLEAAVVEDPGMQAAFGRPPLAERLVIAPGRSGPAERYLTWHRLHVAAA